MKDLPTLTMLSGLGTRMQGVGDASARRMPPNPLPRVSDARAQHETSYQPPLEPSSRAAHGGSSPTHAQSASSAYTHALREQAMPATEHHRPWGEAAPYQAGGLHGHDDEGTGQALAEHSLSPATRRSIAVPPYMPARMRGFGQDAIEAGDYHVAGSQVILRSSPSASASSLGTLENGEGVYAFGDTETDVEHMVGPGGAAIANDGSSPGIEYVHVGTQTHGPGWVAINFLTPGTGAAVSQVPAAQPHPTPSTTTTATPTPAKKDYVTTFLVGGLVGVVVLGGIVLLVRQAQKSHPRQLAHA